MDLILAPPFTYGLVSGQVMNFCSLSASDMLLHWRLNFCGATPSTYGIFTRSTGAYSGGPSGVDPKLRKAIWSGSRVVVYRIAAREGKKKEGPDIDRVVRWSLAKKNMAPYTYY